MLTLKVAMTEESFNEQTQRFVPPEYFELELEHSLVSLSKWESEFEKPFLEENEKTNEEILGYIKAMILTPIYPEDIFDHFSEENVQAIHDYIDRKMTASFVSEPPGKKAPPKREKITSELIYYWLVSYQIPWEAQYWHLNRLFMLVKIFNAKNEKNTPKTKEEIAAERRAINEERKKKYKTNG